MLYRTQFLHECPEKLDWAKYGKPVKDAWASQAR